MTEKKAEQAKRTIADIENDLLKAEEVFADADARLKKAERDRRTALDTVNKHQMEFDEAISALRQRSIPDSKWRLEAQEGDDPEGSGPEGRTASKRSDMTSPAAEFDRLRAVAQSEDDGAQFPGFRILGPSET